MNGLLRLERISYQYVNLAPAQFDEQASRQAAFGLHTVRKRLAGLDEQVDISAALRVIHTASKQAHDGFSAKLGGHFAFDDLPGFIVKSHLISLQDQAADCCLMTFFRGHHDRISVQGCATRIKATTVS